MANINDILNDARIKGCSDVHIGENTGITLRQDGKLIGFEQAFSNEEIKEMILSMCKDRILKIVEKHEDADFVYVNDLGRHRVNIYFQQGYMTAAIRIINEQIKTLEELNLPDVLHKLALLPRGLVLVTGPTGSGKSTTLAAMIDFISSMRNCHILTIEDPIEYVYQQKPCKARGSGSGKTAGFPPAQAFKPVREKLFGVSLLRRAHGYLPGTPCQC